MTFAISSANSYLHGESVRIDGSLNYFLWGKKIVENVIRFTFFSLFIDFDNMAIIVGPEQALQTQDRNDRRQFIRLHKRYTLESDAHTHTHTHTLDYMWRLSGHQQIIIIGLEWKASLTRQMVVYHSTVSWSNIFTFKALGISLKACNWNWLKNVHIFFISTPVPVWAHSWRLHTMLFSRLLNGNLFCVMFTLVSHKQRTNNVDTHCIISLHKRNIFKRPLIFGWIVIDCSFLWQLVSFI